MLFAASLFALFELCFHVKGYYLLKQLQNYSVGFNTSEYAETLLKWHNRLLFYLYYIPLYQFMTFACSIRYPSKFGELKTVISLLFYCVNILCM